MKDTDAFAKQIVKRVHISADRLLTWFGSPRGTYYEVWEGDKSKKIRLKGLFYTKAQAKRFRKKLFKKKLKGIYDY